VSKNKSKIVEVPDTSTEDVLTTLSIVRDEVEASVDDVHEVVVELTDRISAQLAITNELLASLLLAAKWDQIQGAVPGRVDHAHAKFTTIRSQYADRFPSIKMFAGGDRPE
jgi:GTPase